MVYTIGMKKNPFYKSGLNSHFASENASFDAYVNDMREMVEAARIDLTDENREKIIDANSPFEWHPEHPSARNPETDKITNGILLVHGLFDSPNTLLSLAEYFREQQFLVRAILLPGHGTNPGDLLDVEYTEWLKATQFGIESFANEVENLFLCGFSTGGALILQQVLTREIKNLKGLFLFAPAIKLQTPIAVLSNLNNLLHQTVGGIKWFTRSANPDYAKYLSFTFDSAHQVHLLAQIINQEIEKRQISVPIFLVATADDEVLSTKAMLEFFSKNNNPNSRCILYSNNNKNEQATDTRVEIRTSHYPEKKILNFSHMCLPIAPNHPHYGEHGDYQDYLQYEESGTQKPKVITEEIYLGAVTHTNLRQHFLRKLTYNPDFVHMLDKIAEFCKTAYVL